ncbi:MAG TPA: BACON domain-containing carbohydrate-binding protein [Vicinamibacterales bacterium]|nr:BACON domain-containing carbohydrate-binding protein [Vicinamibacterales bacterium]
MNRLLSNRILPPRRLRAGVAAAVGAIAWLAAACGTGSTSIAGPTEGKCQISVTSFTRTFGPSGGSGTVTLQAARECSWSAASPTEWISFPDKTAGQGDGSFSFAVGPNRVPRARQGTIEVSGEKLGVSQDAAPCQFALEPAAVALSGAGGEALVRVSTLAGCAWTARSLVSWLTVTGGASGEGPGEVRVSAQPNPGPARTGDLQVAGHTIRVEQAAAGGPAPPPAPGCQYSATPMSLTFPAGGGQAAVQLATTEACAWTAAASASWLTLGATAGSGPATLTVSAAPNTAAASRTASVLLAGLVVEVKQDAAAAPPPAPCEYALAPAASNVPSAGGTVTLSLTTGSSCAWQASSDAGWTTVGPPASGTGPSSIPVAVAANLTAASRTATIRAGGATARITQEAAAPACTYTVAPASATVPAAGGDVRVDLQTGASCAWTATTDANWLTAAPEVGTGPATVTLRAAANTSTGERAATATVGGQQVRITQPLAAPAPVCTFEVTPGAATLPSEGGSVGFQVATQADCTWTAAAGDGWLTVAPTGGAGPATVAVSAGANTDPAARTGTASIAGTTVTVAQAGAEPPPAAEIRVEGKVQNLAGRCPEVTFSLVGYTVNTTASTAYRPNPPGTDCGDLGNGLSVVVVGSLLPSRVIAATEIILERNVPRP